MRSTTLRLTLEAVILQSKVTSPILIHKNVTDRNLPSLAPEEDSGAAHETVKWRLQDSQVSDWTSRVGRETNRIMEGP